MNRVESMGSIGHRTLLQFLDADDLNGFKNLLDLRQGLQVDDRDDNGTTVLMVSATRGLTHFLKELLSRDAEINAADFGELKK